MAGKKDKQVTSKGGNSFLTIKSGEAENDTATQDNPEVDSYQEKKPKTKKAALKKPDKSEEEKIEEFADSVGKFLDKLDTIKSTLGSLFKKRFSETFGNVQERIMEGKLKFLKPFLPAIIVVQKINERWFNKKSVEVEDDTPEESDEQKNAEPKKPLTFLELAEKNIIFTDNKKKPLYTLEQLKDKSGYVASEAVIAPMVIEQIINAFQEVAPKAKAIPTPEIGKYAGIPMSDVMASITDQDIIEFLEYVRNFPRGYVGKNYRITESFAGWAVSGTPDD